MNSIDQLKKFIPTIKGISDSNRKGLLHIADLIEKEIEATALHALTFYADTKRYESSNRPALEGDPYTEIGSPYMQDVHRDWGQLARSALKEIKIDARR